MKISNKTLSISVITIWILITLLRVGFHQPWYDEAHAYLLAQNYSILDLISEMRYEGHLMIWYLLIMPFAKLKLLYPYPMQIINWTFALGAVLLLWKKAPFHPVTKIIIMFSYPFFAELPVIARCYAVGVFLLLCITNLYKKSLNHPIWYSSLILLCANTSVMALFGACAFGVIFAYDLIKGALSNTVSKKDFRISFSILALTAVLILWQIGGAMGYKVPNEDSFINHFSTFIFGSLATKILSVKIGILLILGLSIISTTILTAIKNKKILFIYLFTLIGMLGCFLFKYSGYSHHFIFFWIYTLITYWLLFNYETTSNKIKNIAEVILILLWGTLIFSIGAKTPYIYNSQSKTLAQKVLHNTETDSRIIIGVQIDTVILPYLEHSNLEFYSYDIGDEAQNCRIFDKSLMFKLYAEKKYLSASWLKKLLSPSKTNYIIMDYYINEKKLLLKDNNTTLKLEKITPLENSLILYKITEAKKVSESF